MTTTLLPRPDAATWRTQAAASQRDRMLVAIAEACVDGGYATTRVSDVISRAGVSRRTFYEHFDNLEGCFLAAYERGVDALSDLLTESVGSLAPDSAWDVVLEAMLTTYLEVLAAEPIFTQFAMVEVLAAGAAARRRYLEVVERFHDLLRHIDDLARSQQKRKAPVSDLALSMFAGGLNRFVMVEVLAGRAHQLVENLDELRALGRLLYAG